jgi:ATP phosphoribosyltransferase regulatory subunit
VTPNPARRLAALDAQAHRLLEVFTRAGYEHVAPDMIQPAQLFLDVVGEGLRARTYVFTDPDGEELCLCPDLTVPTCRLHLARHPAGAMPGRYCYSAPAFRYQPVGADSAHPREFRQAGVECFAAPDKEAADAEVVAVIVAALRDAGLKKFQFRFGDLGLFSALLEALPLPARWRRRLTHHFWRPEAFRAELARLSSRASLAAQRLPRALADALDPAKPEEAEAHLAAYLDETGIELIGTRTLKEIAERLLAEAADAREPPLAAEHAALIEGYVAVKGPAKSATRKLAQLTQAGNIDVSGAFGAFDRRLELLQSVGIDVGDAAFAAEFGRNLAYYTGFVFEIFAPELGERSPLAGGGRYDNLLADVGAPAPVPAVGSCIHTERLLTLREASR